MTSNSFFKYINSNFWSFLLITIIIISFFIFGDFWKFCIDALWVDPIVSQFIGNEWWIISICSLFIVRLKINRRIQKHIGSRFRTLPRLPDTSGNSCVHN